MMMGILLQWWNRALTDWADDFRFLLLGVLVHLAKDHADPAIKKLSQVLLALIGVIVLISSFQYKEKLWQKTISKTVVLEV